MTDQPITPPTDADEPNIDLHADHDLTRCRVEDVVPAEAIPPGMPRTAVHTLCHLLHCATVMSGCLDAEQSVEELAGVAAELGRWQAQHALEQGEGVLEPRLAYMLGAHSAVLALHSQVKTQCAADGSEYPCPTVAAMAMIDPGVKAHVRTSMALHRRNAARWS